MNNAGQVVGSSGTGKQTHALSWTKDGGMVDLGTLGGALSTATALNNAGQVIGYSSTGDYGTHAFLWTKAGGMVDLGTLGGSYCSAHAINDSGQVVGASDTARRRYSRVLVDAGRRHGRPRHARRHLQLRP